MQLPPDYLRRTGYRLPTEAEWEFAARAGSTASRYFGDDESRLPQYSWFDRNTKRERAFPVGQLLPNAWGLFDVYGNVWNGHSIDGARTPADPASPTTWRTRCSP